MIGYVFPGLGWGKGFVREELEVFSRPGLLEIKHCSNQSHTYVVCPWCESGFPYIQLSRATGSHLLDRYWVCSLNLVGLGLYLGCLKLKVTIKRYVARRGIVLSASNIGSVPLPTSTQS